MGNTASPLTSYRLLEPDEPSPVFEYNRVGQSAFVIAVDHASQRLPKRLGDLGLPASELDRHIAWDIGALGVAMIVASTLDASLIAQNYSRLVIDCNRRLGVPTSISTMGEWTEIPGNIGLSEDEVMARRAEIFHPYHDRLCEMLDERVGAGRPTILVGQHSMTPLFKGMRRHMHAAVLYNHDRRLAGPLLDILRADHELVVAENEPYTVSEENAYTIPVHGEARGLPHVEIEIRQDLVLTVGGQAQWAHRIASALQRAQDTFYP